MIDRGGGITSIPLVTRHSNPAAELTAGISTYPKGTGAPLHTHNCDEQVTVLEGAGEVEVEGELWPLRPYDTTYIVAGRVHSFRNIGDVPMKIMWIYPTQTVTRTLVGTGKTIEHLSDADKMS